jgi:F-type H+-transporting ATPase subunit delta
MRGVSRASFAELKDQLPEALAQEGGTSTSGRATSGRATASRASADAASRAETVGDDLFSVLHLLDTEHGLRRALADP